MKVLFDLVLSCWVHQNYKNKIKYLKSGKSFLALLLIQFHEFLCVCNQNFVKMHSKFFLPISCVVICFISSTSIPMFWIIVIWLIISTIDSGRVFLKNWKKKCFKKHYIVMKENICTYNIREYTSYNLIKMSKYYIFQ